MKPIVAMLAKTAEGAMVTDPDGKVIFWNRAAERLLGFHAEDVKGRCCHEVLRGLTLDGKPFCSPSCSILTSLVQGKPVHHFEIQTTTAFGSSIWLCVSSLCLPSRQLGRCHGVHLFHDISKQAKVQQLAYALYAAVCQGPSAIRAARSSPPGQNTLPFQRLTRREREILACLRQGMTTRSIADRLCISPVTVRNHIQHILEKLGVHSRLEALATLSPSPRSAPAR